MIGTRIKMLRHEKGMTQEELGELLGITKAAVQKYEYGTIRNFRSDTIRKMCEIFDAPPVYFVYDEIPDLSTPNDMRNMLEAYFGKWVVEVLTDLDRLNPEGKRKLVDYYNDLMKIEEYKRQKEEPSH